MGTRPSSKYTDGGIRREGDRGMAREEGASDIIPRINPQELQQALQETAEKHLLLAPAERKKLTRVPLS